MKKRKALSLWKTLILVFCALTGVCGLALLGTYLTGGFNQTVVEPNDIYFSQDFSGNGTYDEQTGTFKVVGDFRMTISTHTADVTEKAITLSLAGGKTENGYISNQVIKIPEKVNLNESFQVELVRDEDGWIRGGNTTIRAKSSNKLIDTIKTYVAVDTPVSGIQVGVRGDKPVVANNNFWIDTTFDKPNSKYNYNNTSDTKKLFYMPSSENDIQIVDLENGVFKASEATGNYTVTVYTFVNAFLENKFLQENPTLSGTALNTRFFTNYLSSHANECASKTVNVSVTKPQVNSVTVTNGLNLISNVDTYFRLTANGSDAKHSLGLKITDDDGNSNLENLFGKVGIKIPNNPYFNISGGDIIKVSADGKITTVKTVDNETGASYYVLPKLGDGPENYNWLLSSSEEDASINLYVNFFNYSSDAGYTKLYNDIEEKPFVFTTNPLDEKPLEWDTTPISLTIHYNNNTIIPDEYDLKNSSVELGNNIYREYKYFLVADSSAVDLSEIFLTKDNGVLYDKDYKCEAFNIGSLDGLNGYMLYELEQDKLTALKSYSGNIYLVAATIKTDINGRPETFENADGKKCYKLVAFTSPKTITVNSTLNINDMTAQFVFDEVFNIDNNEVYIPALSNSGNQKKLLTFKFFMDTNENNKAKDAAKIENAFGENSNETLRLEIRDASGTKISDYLKLKDLKPVETGDVTKLQYEGELQIDESLVGTTEDWQKGIAIYPYLVYVDDMGNTSSLKLTGNMGGDTGETVPTDHFIIYTQIAQSLVGKYETEGYTDGIEIVMTTDRTTIKWNNNDALTLATLNDLLSFTIFDQKNSDIEVSDSTVSIYRYRFEEIPQAGKDPVLSLKTSSIAGFISTRGESITTNLRIVVEKLNKISDTESEYREVEGLSKEITITVNSEGVSSLKQSTSTTIGVDTTFEDAPNIATARVSKYTTSTGATEINLANLVQVYTATQGQETETQITNGITYVIDETSLETTTAKQDILKMISLVALNSADTPTNVTSIDNWAGVSLSKIMVLNPFGEDTTIRILVKHSLFVEDIILELTFLSDIKYKVNGSTPTFDVYYNENSDYMVKNGALYSLFADEQYKLNTYAELTSISGNYNYSWATNTTDISDLITSNSQTLVSLGRYAGTNEIYLEIKPVYTFTTVTNIVIYYGIRTEFTFKMKLNIYINPNYIAVQKTGEDLDASHIDLSTMTLSTLSDYYSFFKYTDSVSKDGYKEKGLSATPLNSVLKFDNTAKNDDPSNSKNYISISNLTTSGGGQFGYVENNLNLNVGQTVEQSFYVSIVESGQNRNIDGLVLTFENGQENIRFDNTDNMKLIFNVGYGDSDVNVMAGQIFNKNATTTDGSTSAVPTVVTYNDEYYLLFYRGESYTVYDYFSIEQTSNSNLSIGQKTITVLDSYTSFVTESGNVIRVSRTFDGVLNVNLTFNGIVTQLEKQLVYYANFANVDWAWFIDGYQKLVDNDVYQEITSGNSYEILHDTYNTTTNYKQAGFFYNSLYATTNASLGNKRASLTLSVAQNETIGGEVVAEIKDNKTLVLKDISSEYDNVYIVLQLKFEVDGSSINKSIFYRIKVAPSFELGTTNYPYASEGEYLNTNSDYYQNGSYVVDMEETLDNSNSKYTNSKRLADLTTSVENVTYKYTIKEVLDEKGNPISNYSSYVTFEIVGSEIKITPIATTPFSVVVERNYYHNDVLMLGSAMEYIFLLNQSPEYSHRVTQNGTLLNLVTGTNVYNSTVRAGTTETEYTTLVYDNSSLENLIANYNAYIAGENLENYLHKYFVINKGSKIYNVTTSKVENLENTVGFDTSIYNITHVKNSLNGKDVYIEVTVTNKEDVSDRYKYYLADTTLEDIENNNYQYFYLSDSETTENAKVLHITPNETITHDKNFEIGFYNDKYVMFRINLLVTSRYVISITNDTLNGGNEYNFSQIITSITDINGNNVLGDSVSYTITLADGDVNAGKVLIDDRTITFAQLQNDTTFNFVCEITEGENVYTYDFALIVKGNFTLTSPTIPGADSFSGDNFVINLEGEEFKSFFSKQTDFEAYSFSATEIVTTKEITNENVEADLDRNQELTIYYFFATSYNVDESGNKLPVFDRPLFSFNANYSYKVLMNVALKANYPVPNSDSKLDVEYIGTNFDETAKQYKSIDYNSFFGSIAPFGQENRIAITDLGVAETETRPHDISIMISKISNASVIVSTDGKTRTFTNAGSEIATTTTFDGINLTFVLTNSSIGNGSVDFAIYVNSVEIMYSVVILSTDIITVTPNATNYVDSQETIYLDYYATQEKELFKEARILKYTLKEDALAGTYYVRLHNFVGDLYETVELNVSDTDSGTINFDLGKSYAGYEIVGTYTNANFSTEANIFEFGGEPKLTSRIEVTYYGGIQVEFNDTTKFYLVDNGTEIDRNTFALTDSDYQVTKSVSARVKVGETIFDLKNFVYKLYLDIAFDVEKSVTSIDSYDYASLDAGTRKTLLGTTAQGGLAEVFGIKNKKTGKYYTAKDIENSSATLGLWIYGQVPSVSSIDMRISEANRNAIVYGLHNKLMNSIVSEGDYNIKYVTGLLPRVGNLEGGYIGGDQRYNYLDYQPSVVSNRSVDYELIANGANNDGNFVLIKLVYSAKINDREITKSFDLLFKVSPNSEIDMKISPTSEPSETKVMEVNNQRVNYNNGVYEIICSNGMTESEKLIDFVGTSDSTGILSAKMYSSKVSTADSFTFEYTKDIETNYNTDDLGTKVEWTNSHTFKFTPVSLGLKNYIITMENSFGYKARFYFRLVAESNPKINTTDSNTVFTEGNKLVFGGMFNKIKTEGMASYQFPYVSGKNELSISGKDYISGYTLQTTTSSYGTIIKSVSGESAIETISLENGWSNGAGAPIPDADFNVNNLSGCTIYLTLTIKPSNDDTNSPENYSVSYNGTTLTTSEHVIGIDEKATLGDATVDVVFLKDVDAYAYSNLLQAVDRGSARKSKVNSYTVIGIQFFIKDKNEAIATVGGNNLTFDLDNGVKLVTGSSNSYITNNDMISKGYDFNGSNNNVVNGISNKSQGNYMIVPKIDGIYYGTNRSVDVTMNIYLRDNDNICTLSREVTLQRKDTSNLFANAALTSGYYEIEDGAKLTANSDVTLLNDTLEVVLDDGEEITFEISKDNATWNEVKVEKNTSGYTKTKYISITQNLKGLTSNLTTSDRIYIRATSNNGTQIRYNNIDVLSENSFLMATYSNAIDLNINSKQELLGSNYKTETLYFLYCDGESTTNSATIYQQELTFRVYQLFDSAKTSDSTTIINDYVKVESGSQTYYAVPFESWSTLVNLTKCIKGTSSDLNGGLLSGQQPYKFAFEIVKGGSVDKATGLILTDSNIQVGAYRFTVRLYLKVSGQSGQFEDDKNLIELGEFEFMLNSSTVFTDSNSISVGSNGGVVKINNSSSLVVNSGTAPKVYRSERTSLSAVTHPTEVEGEIYSVAVNDKIDASIASEDITSGYNKNYRLVAVDNTYISNSEYIFTTTGQHTVTIAVTYRTSLTSTRYETKLVNKTIWVYNDQTEDDVYQVAVDASSGTSNYDISLIREGGSWYKLENNGKLTSIPTTITLMASTTKVYDLIHINGTVATHITLTTFAYDEVVDKSAIITLNTNAFDLNHITEFENTKIYKILDDTKMKQLAIEDTFDQVGNYVVVAKNSNGSEKIIRYNITYIKAEDSTSLYSMTVSSKESYQTKLEELVELAIASKRIDCTEYVISEIVNNIFLETPTYQIPTGYTKNILSVDYLVTHKSFKPDGTAVEGNFRVRISYTIYSEAISLEYSMENPGLVNLSSLDEQLINKIHEIDNTITSAEVKYYDINGNLRETNIRVTEFPTTADYYVQVGEKYFKLTVTFVQKQATESV